MIALFRSVKVAFICLVCVGLWMCSKTSDVPSDGCLDITIPSITLDGQVDLSLSSGETQIVSAEADGAVLNVGYSFGGGCDEHEIHLVSPNGWSNDAIPRITLHVFHQDNDLCEALIHMDVCYDLGRWLDEFEVFEVEISGWPAIFRIER